MIVSGIDLLPCPQGHLAAQRVTRESGGSILALAHCGACGGDFDPSLPVDLRALCDGHGRDEPQYCSSVSQHLARVRRILRSRPAFFPHDDGAEGGVATA